MDDIDMVLDEYILPASFVPLAAWATYDLVALHNAIDAELQKRHFMAHNEAVST